MVTMWGKEGGVRNGGKVGHVPTADTRTGVRQLASMHFVSVICVHACSGGKRCTSGLIHMAIQGVALASNKEKKWMLGLFGAIPGKKKAGEERVGNPAKEDSEVRRVPVGEEQEGAGCKGWMVEEGMLLSVGKTVRQIRRLSLHSTQCSPACTRHHESARANHKWLLV